jgi:hypothetical protein
MPGPAPHFRPTFPDAFLAEARRFTAARDAYQGLRTRPVSIGQLMHYLLAWMIASRIALMVTRNTNVLTPQQTAGPTTGAGCETPEVSVGSCDGSTQVGSKRGKSQGCVGTIRRPCHSTKEISAAMRTATPAHRSQLWGLVAVFRAG